MTIAPGFSRNLNTVQVCPSDDPTGETPERTDVTRASNFVHLRTAPRTTAPLFGDQGLHPGAPGNTRINDWGGTAQAGQQFVVTGERETGPRSGSAAARCGSTTLTAGTLSRRMV
ncbi:hypothetical protein ACFZAG_37955 [Streptomyces sp. NPDC012403]|uniref:hypothetical protein n=1 Tax=Streptomyces sp. NPDC012403 TaxID=3364831 RepID=UPI0036EE6413